MVFKEKNDKGEFNSLLAKKKSAVQESAKLAQAEVNRLRLEKEF